MNEIVDNITKFETGAVRSSDRAGQRYDLISPIGIRRIAETCDEGAKKYDDFNWEKGMPVHDLLNHVIAHCYMYLSGDRSEDHLAHAGWGCLAACHSEELWPHLNEGHLRGEGCKAPTTTAKPLTPVEQHGLACDAFYKGCVDTTLCGD